MKISSCHLCAQSHELQLLLPGSVLVGLVLLPPLVSEKLLLTTDSDPWGNRDSFLERLSDRKVSGVLRGQCCTRHSPPVIWFAVKVMHQMFIPSCVLKASD